MDARVEPNFATILLRQAAGRKLGGSIDTVATVNKAFSSCSTQSPDVPPL